MSRAVAGSAFLLGLMVIGTSNALGACPTIVQYIVSAESTWTYAAVDQVSLSKSGSAVTGSLRYEIYNVSNPGGEIDQLFLAADRNVIATIYSGHPGGCPGQKASWTATGASLSGLPSGTYTLYVVRTAATSADAGINHYENEYGGWRVAVGTVTIGSSSGGCGPTVTQYVVSDPNTWTYAAVDQVSLSKSGSAVTGSLRYEIYNVNNPGGEIDQLFLAADRNVIATIYNGHPGGCPGQKASWTATGASLSGLPSGTYTLYVVRTAATSADAGINHYENEYGGWRVAVGSIAVDSRDANVPTEPNTPILPPVQIDVCGAGACGVGAAGWMPMTFALVGLSRMRTVREVASS